jgi:hypothetical protein
MNDYWRMVGEWNAIVAQPLSDEAKEEACLAVLRIYIDVMARRRIGQPNPALRFYADMLILKHDILPVFTKGNDLERFALFPLSRLVWDWVERHTSALSGRRIA